jgi:putative nucleotidyltransferase with HDIG domain
MRDAHDLPPTSVGGPGALADELSALSAATEDLARQPTRRTMLARAARHLTVRVGATATLVSRLEGNMLRPAAVYSPVPFAPVDTWDYLVDDFPITRDILETGVPRAVTLHDERVDPSEAFVLREVGMEAVLIHRIAVGGRPWGLVEIYDARPRFYGRAEIAITELVVAQTAALLAQFEHADATERVYRETLASLADALEAKDAWTSDHTNEVARLAVDVGRVLGVDDDDLRTVELGALLHDIGKIAVPESILRKPGPLTDEEWEVMRRHPEAGERVLAPISSLREVLPVVRGSHERWDGQGYPDGLAGDAIPLGARIVAVCDAYCAMTEQRPYRSSLSPVEAASELRANAATQFDPDCVDAFLRVIAGGGANEVRLHRPSHVVAS